MANDRLSDLCELLLWLSAQRRWNEVLVVVEEIEREMTK